MPIAIVTRVEKFLPDNYNMSKFTSAAIYEEIEAAHDELLIALQPKTPSAGRPVDVLIETMLTAITIRQQMDTLGDEEDSKTTRLQKRVDRLIALRRVSAELDATSYDLPVGPDGRDAEGADAPHRIFEVPRPASDDYEGVTADSPHRPGNWSD